MGLVPVGYSYLYSDLWPGQQDILSHSFTPYVLYVLKPMARLSSSFLELGVVAVNLAPSGSQLSYK